MSANPNGDDPRLDELLLRWEELHEHGQSVSPGELCSTCPELAEELGRRIALLRQLDPLLDGNTADGKPAQPAASGAPRRESATARAEFRELRFHAAGALGEVFLARNAELNREVALKFLKPERTRDPDSRRRFLQEAEVTGRLEHPGVVPIYALGTDAAGSPCYAMRFIRGSTLQDAIDAFHVAETPGRDPTERSLALRYFLGRFVSICGTMAYAHSRGILHRDLKPRNVMLGKYDETLIVDWGLARPFERDEAARSVGEETLTPGFGSGEDGSETPTVGAVGTPAYMSPEQAEARWDLVGPASDLFSLGGILYALLTGKAPYHGSKVGEIMEKVKRCEFPPPREVKPATPRALQAICLKAMARRPEDRYATALELAADVRRWLANEPVTAYPEPSIARARRWMRRHRTLVTSAAMVLVFGLASLAAFATVLAGKNRELDAKNSALSDKNRELDARNAELAAKNLELERQRKRAEEREDLAIAAVKRFRDVVQGNPELKDRPELDALRKALLREPLEFFRKLRDQLQSDRDTQPRALARLAYANFDLALTTAEIGTISDAMRSYSESTAILQQLARDYPTVAEYQNNLAGSYIGIGNLMRESGRMSEALSSYRDALTILERLARDHPTDADYRRNVAVAQANIGAILKIAGRVTEAMEPFLKAREIWERLARDHPAVAEHQFNLAGLHNNIGLVLDATGSSTEAMEEHRGAREVLERLTRDHPTIARYRGELAMSYDHIGRRLKLAGQAAEAMESHRKALAIRERLVREHPSVTEYRGSLAWSHNYIGALLLAAGRPLEAVEEHRKALAILARLVRDHPGVVDYRREMARSLGLIESSGPSWGRSSEAIESYREGLATCERLVRDHPDLDEFRQELAQHQDNFAIALWYGRDYRGAAEAHRRAILNYSALLKANPANRAARQALSLSQSNLGNALRDAGDADSAVESYRQAIATATVLVDAAPEDAPYRAALGRAFHNLGHVLWAQGRHEEAIRAYREALTHERLAFDRSPESTWHRRILSESEAGLAACLRAIGRVQEAAQITRARKSLWKSNGVELYNAARELALCVPIVMHAADRASLAAEAVETLKQAIAVGWYNPRHTSRDPDLDPLRDRDDFRELLAEMFDVAFPADPFAR